MPWQLLARPVASGWRRTAPYRGRVGSALAIPLLAGLVQGCAASLASTSVGPNPSNPSAPAPAVRYRSTIAPYTSLRPVEPDLQQQNQQGSPAPKSAE